MELTDNLVENLDHLGAWGILRTDRELRIVGWNRWLEKHSGKRAADVLGRHLFEVYRDLIERNLDQHYRRALDGQAGILSQRFHQYLLPMPPTAANCELMHMQQTARISPLIADDVVIGTLTLIEDVTERVITEQELRQQAERLEEANRHKDEFLAMLAHELRNPLAPIRNGASLLNMIAPDNEDARQACAMIERQVAHMARLLEDLLDVSRIARGKVRLQKESCDIVKLLHQVASDYRPILADSGQRMLIDIEMSPCWIEGDCIRLSQIFSNLVQNAGKFTNSGGEVRITAVVDRELNEFVATVSDTGIGMSAEVLARVFDAFSQAESSLARSQGGLGLGLALVKGLAELHDGYVEAHSDGLGKGSEFRVHLPIKEASQSILAVTLAEAGQGHDFRRALVIEDNRDAAITMKMLIQRFGLEVELAFTGPEGVDVARRFQPDIVFCDIGLPSMDGFAVAKILRGESVTRDAYLVAQSGYGRVEDVQQSRAAGFDEHLVKPVSVSELERVLAAKPSIANRPAAP